MSVVVAVVGAGVMGVDVASTLSHYGYKVILKDNNPRALEEAPSIIRRNIRYYRTINSNFSYWNTSEILNCISFTDEYDGFENVSWVIENTTENLEVKTSVLKELGNVCGEETMYGINTSCLSITKLASVLPKPDKVIGMHFMNPVPLKKIVETVRGFHTSDETIQASELLLKSLRL